MKIIFRIIIFLLPAIMLWSISCVHNAKEAVNENNLRRQLETYVAQGRNEEALGIYLDLRSIDSDNRELMQGYIATIKVLHKMAEDQYTVGNYAASERIYKLLLTGIEQQGSFSALGPLNEKTLNVRIRESRIGHAMQLSRQHMNSENFLMALNSLKVVHMQYPEDDSLRESYIATMEQIKKRAEKALGTEDYALAGRAYHALNKNLSYTENIAPAPLFKGQSLDMLLTYCSASLMKQALKRYREGDLPAAIILWNKILDFSSSNKEVQKAIEIASKQLRNVEHIEKSEHPSAGQGD